MLKVQKVTELRAFTVPLKFTAHWKKRWIFVLKFEFIGKMKTKNLLFYFGYKHPEVNHANRKNFKGLVSVENPYQHVFEPPGSGPISQRYGSGSDTGSETFVLDPQHCFEKWFTCTVPVFQTRMIHMFLSLSNPHPEKLVRGTDPRIRIRIHTKMSRIRNTGYKWYIFSEFGSKNWRLTPRFSSVE